MTRVLAYKSQVACSVTIAALGTRCFQAAILKLLFSTVLHLVFNAIINSVQNGCFKMFSIIKYICLLGLFIQQCFSNHTTYCAYGAHIITHFTL